MSHYRYTLTDEELDEAYYKAHPFEQLANNLKETQMFDNKTYDILKYIAQLVLPGLGTLYFTLSSIWGLPYGEQVVGTITAIDTFLGLLLGFSSSRYNGDGTMIVDTSDEDVDVYRMELNSPVETLGEKDQVTFKVDRIG